MLSQLSSLARSSVIALAALCVGSGGSARGTAWSDRHAGGRDSSANKPILVEMGEGRDHGPGYQVWRRNGILERRSQLEWRWPQRWNGGRNWDNGRATIATTAATITGTGGAMTGAAGGAFALGLGLGVPLGYYGGYYNNNYYDGYYDEPIYRPRVIERRVYRGGGGACRMVLQPLSLVPRMGQYLPALSRAAPALLFAL